MSNQTTPPSGGLSFLGALTILFIALKLLGLTTWSWWIVLSPFWIPVGVFGLCVILYIVLTAIDVGKESKED